MKLNCQMSSQYINNGISQTLWQLSSVNVIQQDITDFFINSFEIWIKILTLSLSSITGKYVIIWLQQIIAEHYCSKYNIREMFGDILYWYKDGNVATSCQYKSVLCNIRPISIPETVLGTKNTLEKKPQKWKHLAASFTKKGQNLF